MRDKSNLEREPVQIVASHGPRSGITTVARFERWRLTHMEAVILEVHWDELAALQEDIERVEMEFERRALSKLTQPAVVGAVCTQNTGKGART